MSPDQQNKLTLMILKQGLRLRSVFKISKVQKCVCPFQKSSAFNDLLDRIFQKFAVHLIRKQLVQTLRQILNFSKLKKKE